MPKLFLLAVLCTYRVFTAEPFTDNSISSRKGILCWLSDNTKFKSCEDESTTEGWMMVVQRRQGKSVTYLE